MRSILFIPGIRPNMIAKAPGIPADLFCLDLEDSVPPAEKATARQIVATHLDTLDVGRRGLAVRVNALTTGLLDEDLEAVVHPRLQAISLPKVESAEQVREVDARLALLEQARGLPPGQIKLLCWIEMAIAVINVYSIASACPRVAAVSFGAEDFAADLEVARTREGLEISYPRAVIAVAARAAGVAAIDTPEPDFKDLENLEVDARRARNLGYQGKFCIHPSQVEIVNRVFTPAEAEIEYARRVVAAYEEAERQGIGAVALDGKMIDAPVVLRARQLLQRAASIAALAG
ncbi:MAG: CoA ester lyase [Chloroflexi bacterium]|nr:CoA ester lyase [Chloroflexota bacterium]